jgi:hypothetical protein
LLPVSPPKKQVYHSKEAFVEDVTRMFDNCRKFNDDTTEYYRLADSLQAYFL